METRDGSAQGLSPVGGLLSREPLRRPVQDPRGLLIPYVHAGMTVLELGPGMGFFTLELARLVVRASASSP